MTAKLQIVLVNSNGQAGAHWGLMSKGTRFQPSLICYKEQQRACAPTLGVNHHLSSLTQKCRKRKVQGSKQKQKRKAGKKGTHREAVLGSRVTLISALLADIKDFATIGSIAIDRRCRLQRLVITTPIVEQVAEHTVMVFQSHDHPLAV